MPTLNELITAVIGGAEEAEQEIEKEAGVREQDPAASVSAAPTEIEKLATALEFVGRRGVASFGKTAAAKACVKCGGKIVKSVCSKCGSLVKKAAHTNAATAAPPGTNEHQTHREHVQKQVQPHSAAPSMKEPGYGQIPNNENDKPGGGGSVDTTGKQTGDHHPGLASNEAAINYDKKAKAKLVSPSLSALLDATPYADPKLKENLSNASGKGDKNIHSKTASAPIDKELLRAELAKRTANRLGDQ